MKNTNNGMTMVEILVAILIAAMAIASGMAFFVKAFGMNYRTSDHVLAQDKASSMAEEMMMYVLSTDTDLQGQNINGQRTIDWRIEQIENDWVVHIAAFGDRTESFPVDTNPAPFNSRPRPMLIQAFCFSMWPIPQADAFGIYGGGYQQYWNLDAGGLGSGGGCMAQFDNFRAANPSLTSIRLKTAYARFAYETRESLGLL